MNAVIVLRFVLPVFTLALVTGVGWGQERARTVSLDEAIELFLANNLTLQDQELEIDKARGERKTAGLWANPALSYSREAVSSGDLDESEYVIGLEYEFDFFGKRSVRRRASDYAIDAAESGYNHDKIAGVAELKHIYVHTFLAKERVALLESTAEVFEEAVRAGEARLEEGDISGFDQLRLAAEGARYRRELACAQIEYAGLQRQLGVLISPVGGTGLYEPTESLSYPSLDLDLEEAIERALKNRPDLKQVEYALRSASEKVRSEKRERFPVLSLFGGYKSQSDDFTGSAIAVGLSLPVFDRNQGNVFVAQAELGQIERRKALLERRVRAEVETVFARVASLESQLKRWGESPPANTGDILDIARTSYSEGEMSLLELLDAAEANYDAEFARSELQAEYVLSLVALERAIGLGVER